MVRFEEFTIMLQNFAQKKFAPQTDKYPTVCVPARNSIDESVTKIEIIGAEENLDGSVTLRPNRFRPEAGVRDRLRTALHETLDEVDDSQAKPAPAQSQNENQSSTRYAPWQCLQNLFELGEHLLIK